MQHPFDSITDFIFLETELASADLILVPGGSSPELMERAAELYLQGLAPLILPSGGYNNRIQDYPSEWEFLRQIAVERGVPDEAILREDRATHTFGNAQFSWQVITEQGLKIEKIIMVCKAFHARRALMTYQTVFPLDIQFYIAPVVDYRGVRKEDWFLDPVRIQKVMSEVVKIGTYFPEHIPAWAEQQQKDIQKPR